VEARINSALENWLARHDPSLAEERGEPGGETKGKSHAADR
jgi:hypothetical protein